MKTQRRGFTLVELLVVIGIIVLLIAILLPVAGKVKVQAQTARTQSTINAIAGACERYHQDHRAYPGLFTNAQLQAGTSTFGFAVGPAGPGAGNNLTGTENMVLSLVGGASSDASGNPAGVTVDANNTIGKGPLNFSPSVLNRVRKAPYLEDSGNVLLPKQSPAGSYQDFGCYQSDPEQIGGKSASPDSTMPEFYDNYSDRRPIIYLRANLARATGPSPAFKVAPTGADPTSANLDLPYGRAEFAYYGRVSAGSFPGDFRWNTDTTVDPAAYTYTHPATNDDYDYYKNESNYLRHPNVVNAPRGRDKFILIDAGPDRVFGTTDDIFYGG